MWVRSLLLVAGLLLLGFVMRAGAEQLVIGDFSAGRTEHWNPERFRGETVYELIRFDDGQVLAAHSVNSASGLVREMTVDLQAYPYLNWRWRVDTSLPEQDETRKDGDDYAARIYVVVSGGLVFWRTRALNYVWSSRTAVNSPWPNAYASDNVVMLAVRSADDLTGTWHTEKRNVYDDLKTVFGDDIRYIHAVALMTDSDDSNSEVRAYYGDIYFSQN